MRSESIYAMSLYRESASDFIKPIGVDVTAAMVGVHRSRWTSVSPDDATPSAASAKMVAGRFDLLPIDPGPPQPVTEYFCTRRPGEWEKDKLVRQEVSHRNLIPYDTPVMALIHKFANEKAPFYFLGSHDEIVGLVSAVNINCRDAKAALNSLFITLEDRLAAFVRALVPTEEIVDSLKDTSKVQWSEDRAGNQELDPAEYLYFAGLIKLVSKKKLYRHLGFTTKGQFEKIQGIVDLRNLLAHPVRSLITNDCPPQRLWKRIERAQDLRFRLVQFARKQDEAGTGAGR